LSVARSAGAVGRGRLDKVVLARRVDLEAAAPIDVGDVLRRLEATAPGATIFALPGAGERAFLGATPETLVVTRGREFRTMALAGSIGRGASEAEDERLAGELLASDKDREEHAVVVQMLRATLAPLTERLDVARTPHVVRLRTVQHLASHVSGTLGTEEGILSLVGRLHPTPAVGGWPRDLALELIDEQEGIDRGWYAGPVGWVGADGDGAFVVGIRSGVLDATQATLFAGCGIVADSEPDREWDESEMKLRALASALGRVEG
jgi:isochorismate synthase